MEAEEEEGEMPLPSVLESLEGKPDYYKEIYAEVEGKWVLDGDVENHPKAMNLKSTLDKERKARRDAEKEKEKFADVNLERWAKLKDLEEEELETFHQWREEKEKTGGGTKPPVTDEEFEKRYERALKKHESERLALEKQVADLKIINEKTAVQMREDRKRTALLDACSGAGLLKEAVEDAMNLGMQVWQISPDGDLVIYDKEGNEQIGADLKPLQPLEWLMSKAQDKAHWWPRNSGGGAGGGNGTGYGKVTRKADLRNVEEQAAFVKKHGKDAYLNLPA